MITNFCWLLLMSKMNMKRLIFPVVRFYSLLLANVSSVYIKLIMC